MTNTVEYKPFTSLPVQLPVRAENNNNNVSVLGQNLPQNTSVQNIQPVDTAGSNNKSKSRMITAAAGFIAFAGVVIWGLPAMRHACFDKNKQLKLLSENALNNAIESRPFKFFGEKFVNIADAIEGRVTKPVKKFLRQNLFNYINIKDKK